MSYTLGKQFVLDDEDEFEEETITEKILSLSDKLSEEIIVSNIEDHIANKYSSTERMNYVTLYKNKLDELKEKDEDVNTAELKDGIYAITERVINIVKAGLNEEYAVTIGEDVEDTNNLYAYLENIEAMYEFFFIRNYQNIVDLLYTKLIADKQKFIDSYKEIYNETQDNDIFVTFSKKKFRNLNDAIISNYITDILYDIKSTYTSGYQLFKDIVNLDLYEMYNFKINNLLDDLGTGLVFLNDEIAAEQYLGILDNKEMFIEIRNEVLLKFLENVEVDTTYGQAE